MRTSVPAALAALVLALPIVLLTDSPAGAAAVFVEVNPDTVRAGDEVSLRASCDDNLEAATVRTGPLGTVTVSPRYGFLTATTKVPAKTKAGTYDVDLTCAGGETATSTLHVVAKVEPARGPATGGGGTAPGRSVPMLIGGGATAVVAGVFLGVVALRRRRLG
ncbi:hypothetical protein GCM10010435_50810 [Winogradskya consettensis]|uniref:Ig-like domain-containing protein n=1 Tax=Winogradskya consettensis TaxID=113560 RepID=A0A919VQR2_9ACTN|nr:hypothetical protein [Actinoplanes consettensis]GIM72085.1 hypothetical protein Aco04nite_28620 [Actinoplanes consettensis]